MNYLPMAKSLIAEVVGPVTILLCVLSDARPDTPQPRVKLGPWAGDLKVGQGMNAAGRNLRGSEFVGQELADAVFDRCDLSGVHFWDCNLSRASFRGADLSKASLDECPSIRDADFTDAVITGLAGDFSLTPKQLQSTHSYKIKDLRGCFLISAYDPRAPTAAPTYDFRGAKLDGARLSYGDFRNCDFTDATIDRVTFYGGRMTFAQIASTKSFQCRSLRRMDFALLLEGEQDFFEIDLTGTRLGPGSGTRPRFQNAIIRDCTVGRDFRKEDLYSTRDYQKGHLRGISFLEVDMCRWDLARQNLTGCRFAGCALTHADLTDAIITDVRIEHGRHRVTGLTAEQIKSTWNYKHNRMDGIVLPKELAEQLKAK